MNNQATTESWMIDIIAPPDFFHFKFLYDFVPATNSSKWISSVSGPHLPKSLPNCGPRTFVRYMTHRRHSNTYLAREYGIDKTTIFTGWWVMSEIPNNRPPKLYTDIVFGNSIVFNKILVKPLWVDFHMIYATFNNVFDDINKSWKFVGGPGEDNYNTPTIIDIRSTGKTYDDAVLTMDQYSCMAEAGWLAKVYNTRWCFLKKIENVLSLYEAEGTISSPTFPGEVKFPSGSLDDCSKPYVRAVWGPEMLWTRKNYQC